MSKDCRCKYADIGLSTQNGGHLSICNQSRQVFQDEYGNYMTLAQYSLADAWNSPTRLEIKNALENGIEHPNCQDCWNEEAAGRSSKRMIVNEHLPHIKPLPDQPVSVMLKPGNLCNLACRHCNPFSSSRWVKDYFKVEAKQPDWTSYIQQFSEIQDSYNDANPVWQDLKNWAPGIEFYELYGAEPMLIDPLWEVIKVSSQSTNGRNTVVNINTNGTILRDDTEDIFKKFFKVVLNLSVDGINDQFEYLRYPAKWDKFLSNLDAYQHLAAVWRNISISVSCTVSALNIYYTDEIWKFFHDRGIHVGFNILHRPDHLNMRILPDAVKQQISDKLRSTGTPAQNLIDMLNSPIQNSEKHLLDFWVFTEGYDDLRGESYAETFPEMFNILANSR
jgi:hypothetical protein